MSSFNYFIISCAFLQSCILADTIKEETNTDNLYMHFGKEVSSPKNTEYHEIKESLNTDKRLYSKHTHEQYKYLFQMNQIKNAKSKELQQNNFAFVYESDDKARNQFYNNPFISHSLNTPDRRDNYGRRFDYNNYNRRIPQNPGISQHITWTLSDEGRPKREQLLLEKPFTQTGTISRTRLRRAKPSGKPSYNEDFPYHDETSPPNDNSWPSTHGGPRPTPRRGPPNHAGPPPHRGPPQKIPSHTLSHEGSPPHRGPPSHAGPPQNVKPHQHGRPPSNRPSPHNDPSPPRQPPSYEESTQFQQMVNIPTAVNSYTDSYQNQQTNPTYTTYVDRNNTPQSSTQTTRPPIYWFQAQAVTPEE